MSVEQQQTHPADSVGEAPKRDCSRCGVEIPLDRIHILPRTQLCCACSHDVGGETKVVVVKLAKNGDILETATIERNWRSQN